MLPLVHLLDVLVYGIVPLLQVIFVIAAEDPATRLILQLDTMLKLVMRRHVSEILYGHICELYQIDLFVTFFFVVEDHLAQHNNLPLLESIRLIRLFEKLAFALVKPVFDYQITPTFDFFRLLVKAVHFEAQKVVESLVVAQEIIVELYLVVEEGSLDLLNH